MNLTSIEENLIRLGTRVAFGLVAGIGVALIASGNAIYIAFGGMMVCAAFPECFGLGGIGRDLEIEWEEEYDQEDV